MTQSHVDELSFSAPLSCLRFSTSALLAHLIPSLNRRTQNPARSGSSRVMMITMARTSARKVIVSSLSSCTRSRRARGDRGEASLPATRGQSLRMQRRSRRAVYSANLLSEPGAPGAAGAAKGQSLRRVGSDGESMDRRSCFRPLKPLTVCRQILGQFRHDCPGM